MGLNRFDLNKLNVFTVAADLGSFTAAARQLGLTRSAVSQSIASLEQTLGFQLFHRIGRRLVLAERGSRLRDQTREYRAGLERVLDELTGSVGEPSGPARLGMFVGVSKARLTNFLAKFLQRFPRVTVKLLFMPQAELAACLLDRRIDAALSIHSLSRQSRVLDSQRLFREELVLVSGKKHHLPRPSLRQVRQLPIVEYYEGAELTRAWIRHHYREDPGALRIRAYAAAVDFVLDLIEKNVGVGIVPRYVAEPWLKSGRILQIRTKRPELADVIWLNQIRGLRHDPAPAKLLEALAAAFAEPRPAGL